MKFMQKNRVSSLGDRSWILGERSQLCAKLLPSSTHYPYCRQRHPADDVTPGLLTSQTKRPRTYRIPLIDFEVIYYVVFLVAFEKNDVYLFSECRKSNSQMFRETIRENNYAIEYCLYYNTFWQIPTYFNFSQQDHFQELFNSCRQVGGHVK